MPSLEKALELRQLAQGHKLESKFACVVAAADVTALPDGVSCATLPVSTTLAAGISSTKFVKMACVLLGSESPVLPVSLVKKVQNAPVAKDLATVRFFVPRKFVSREQWDVWNAKATSIIQDWVQVDKACSIHTSYGWSRTEQKNRNGEKEELVIGYAKVLVEKLDKLLAHSGRSGVFLDRLAKERDKKQFVTWVNGDASDPWLT